MISARGDLVVTCRACGLTHEIELMDAQVTPDTPRVLGWEPHPDGGWCCPFPECAPWLGDAA
jgi:hypothetical protein